jgi:apolipoprotein N-acyltransferase
MPAVSPLILLGLGGLLSAFSYSSQWTIPLASWLAPIFLLRFARIQGRWSLAWIWLVSVLALAVSHRGVIDVPGLLYPALVCLMATPFILPYLADRLLAPRLPGFAASLAFPLTWTTMEFATAHVNPYGSWGSLAYTQYGDVPLMQLASVTGLWGISFLITWFASVVNWAWSKDFVWSHVGAGVLVYATVWCLVMLLGAARFAFAPDPPTVRVAGIGLPEGVLDLKTRMQVYDPALPDTERGTMRRVLAPLHERLFEWTQREAKAGAKLVVWHETAAPVFLEDEPALLERGQELARAESIYLLMGLGTIHRGAIPRVENKAVLLTPSGEIAFHYRKNRPVPGQESQWSIRGDGKLRSADTPYGRIAVAICSDLDYPFPPLIRQVGQARADIFLVPSSDWEAIKHLHPHQAAFQAIANGVALVRPDRWGVSMSFDRYGRLLAAMDHFTSTERVMVAYVPMRGGPTVYSRLGDWFGWLCGVGLLAAIAIGVRRD